MIWGMRTISVGPPVWAMAWPVLFVAGVAVPAMTSGSAGANFGAAILVLLVAAVVYRVAWLSFRASADGIVIRNFFYTRRIPLGQVLGFEAGRAGVRGLPALRILTPTRKIPVDVYVARAPWLVFSSPARLERIAAELTAWAEAAPQRTGELTAEPAAPTDPG
jgi:hypothetical protein